MTVRYEVNCQPNNDRHLITDTYGTFDTLDDALDFCRENSVGEGRLLSMRIDQQLFDDANLDGGHEVVCIHNPYELLRIFEEGSEIRWDQKYFTVVIAETNDGIHNCATEEEAIADIEEMEKEDIEEFGEDSFQEDHYAIRVTEGDESYMTTELCHISTVKKPSWW